MKTKALMLVLFFLLKVGAVPAVFSAADCRAFSLSAAASKRLKIGAGAIAALVLVGVGIHGLLRGRQRAAPSQMAASYDLTAVNVQRVNTPSISAVLRAGAAADALGAPVEFFGHCAEGFFRERGVGVCLSGSLSGVSEALAFVGGGAGGVLPVTDDTIMTEVTLNAIRLWSDLPADERTLSALMEGIAQATLANYRGRNKKKSYSWADWHRAPGAQCVKAIEDYASSGQWDRSFLKKRLVGREAGSGKVMDSAAFGCAFTDAAVAAYLAQIHAKISHPDVVSQAACAAFAYAVSRALYGHETLPVLIAGMKEVAGAVSRAHRDAEAAQWRAARPYWPRWRQNSACQPYTVAERIGDVEKDVERGVSLEKILQKHGGWGAPDLMAAVAATALCAERCGWTVKEAVLAVVNADSLPGGIDRDTVASAVAQFLAARGLPLGFENDELCAIERDETRRVHQEGEAYAALSN